MPKAFLAILNSSFQLRWHCQSRDRECMNKAPFIDIFYILHITNQKGILLFNIHRLKFQMLLKSDVRKWKRVHEILYPFLQKVCAELPALSHMPLVCPVAGSLHSHREGEWRQRYHLEGVPDVPVACSWARMN